MADDIRDKAKAVAAQLHAAHTINGLPFIAFLNDVVLNFRQFFPELEGDETIESAIWLHKAVNMTPLELWDVGEMFNETIASTLVYAATPPRDNRLSAVSDGLRNAGNVKASTVVLIASTYTTLSYVYNGPTLSAADRKLYETIFTYFVKLVRVHISSSYSDLSQGFEEMVNELSALVGISPPRLPEGARNNRPHNW